MSDRKAELDRKKAKLAALREEKLRKAKEKEQKEATNGVVPPVSTEELRTDTEELLKTLGIPPPTENVSTVPATTPNSLSESPKLLSSPKQRQRKLQYGKISQTTIPPKETVNYSKEVQTMQQTEHSSREMLAYDDANREEDLDTRTALAELQKIQAAKKEEEQQIREEPKIRELSEDEKQEIMNSDDFLRFFQRSSRLIDRAINEPYDLFTDYSGADREENDLDYQSRNVIKLNRDFFDDRWSRHRVITDVDWSPIFPELVVAAYNANEEAPHEPDGVCLVWSTKYKRNTPEYIFHCQSAVTSVTFAKFQPNLLIGGTYSGQIVLWDNRTSKRSPIQRTPLSATAHTHPVYSISVAGTQNAHNLISVSSDGKLCAWSLDMLAQPQESRDLQYRQSKSVASTCFAFFANDVNNFVVGSEEGPLYSGCRHGQKAGLIDAFEGHYGPVTGLDTHNTSGQVDFSHLFLSCSIDWTVKLWSLRDNKPLYSFEDNSEYVYDVAWSPLHPAMFATADGAGRLDIWHLNNDAEVPSASIVMDNQAAINKCKWHSSGLHIATGDDFGRLRLFDINEQMATPRSDEWTQFSETIAELKSTSADQREDESGLSSSAR